MGEGNSYRVLAFWGFGVISFSRLSFWTLACFVFLAVHVLYFSFFWPAGVFVCVCACLKPFSVFSVFCFVILLGSKATPTTLRFMALSLQREFQELIMGEFIR